MSNWKSKYGVIQTAATSCHIVQAGAQRIPCCGIKVHLFNHCVSHTLAVLAEQVVKVQISAELLAHLTLAVEIFSVNFRDADCLAINGLGDQLAKQTFACAIASVQD